MSDTIVFVQVQSPDKIEVSTSNNIDYTLSLINPTPLQISVSPQAGLPGMDADNLIKECNSLSAENIAFASGTKIVIRTDLL
jgi:hypothetical protein